MMAEKKFGDSFQVHESFLTQNRLTSCARRCDRTERRDTSPLLQHEGLSRAEVRQGTQE